ncbi:MAG: CBS domain-containing protein [Acidimicrobiia bacterium]|nr:CBS domain-containing protein [Acidimicrobiia bacterium]
MAASTPVRDIMTTEVVTFTISDDVRSAMETLIERNIDAAPVLDESGAVAGVLSTGDLIVKESRLHFPTVISILGASFELKSRDFDDDIEKALGSSVGDVMSHPAIICPADATVEDAATLMHDNDISRLPVVDGSSLVGIVSRGDIIRGMLRRP